MLPCTQQITAVDSELRRLDVVTLYVTERCNSRCVTCDYWRHGRDDLAFDTIRALLPDLRRMQTRTVLLSGGEPLLNPAWSLIADSLRSNGQQVWLVTSGLALAKHAKRVAACFDHVTVSLDGADAATYQSIRGLDAFEKVCEGVRRLAAHGVAASLRVTLQRGNYRQLAAFVALAGTLGASQVSFLAVDVANPHAFGRTESAAENLTLQTADFAIFEQLIAELERTHAADFQSGFIAESPQKLRRILQYVEAVRGRTDYPPVRCNAPEFSAVVGARGQVQPCFFIAGPAEANVSQSLPAALNGTASRALRSAIARGGRRECKTCVCALWRDPGAP